MAAAGAAPPAGGGGFVRAADEVIGPYAERWASKLVGYVTNQKSFRRALHRMDPRAVAGIHALAPGALGLLVGLMFPNTLFGNAQAAAVAKNFLMQGIRKAADAFEQGEDLNSEAFADQLEADMAAAEAELKAAEVIVDAFGRFHDPNCADMMAAAASAGRRGRVQRVKLLDAMNSPRLRPADCCIEKMQKTLEKPATAAANKPPPRPKSAMEVIGRLSEHPRKILLERVLGESDPAIHERWVKALMELDSIDEAMAIVAAIETGEDPGPLLGLLENQGIRSWLKQDGEWAAGQAKKAGGAIGSAASTAGKAVGRAAAVAGKAVWDEVDRDADGVGREFDSWASKLEVWGQARGVIPPVGGPVPPAPVIPIPPAAPMPPRPGLWCLLADAIFPWRW